MYCDGKETAGKTRAGSDGKREEGGEVGRGRGVERVRGTFGVKLTCN